MRASGILMHISSLPSDYGIGTLGREARKFVDFLEKAGQAYWQILPVCPTSYGDSPYQSFSSFAGNPYFIDLKMLCKDGYLTKKECDSYEWGSKETEVDFGILYENRYELLKKAHMWRSLKKYANEKGIQIIGDVPIYVAYDSADVWANPNQFYLDENLRPIEVAGCPPDAFTEDGQLWGNPLFRWDVMKKDGYCFWTKRIRAMSKLYDVVRIDHFRGFDSYYAIPANATTAKNGVWKEGPGIDLFHVLEEKLGKLNIIVEDLGFLTPSVKKLVKDSGFPGMKVLQFAFDPREESDYIPHTYHSHCVVYTGTHDNDTILGWMKTAPKECMDYAKKYLKLTKDEGYHWGMMRGAWASVSDLAIVTMQDVLGLGSSARMNTPSTLGCNWKWRAKKEEITTQLARKIRKYAELYGRVKK